MLDDRGPASLVPEDVEAVLAALDQLAPALGPLDRDTFAFNVPINAVGSVLERIRLSDPELIATYVVAARAMLEDA